MLRGLGRVRSGTRRFAACLHSDEDDGREGDSAPFVGGMALGKARGRGGVGIKLVPNSHTTK